MLQNRLNHLNNKDLINYFFNIKLNETLNFEYDGNHLKERGINNFSIKFEC